MLEIGTYYDKGIDKRFKVNVFVREIKSTEVLARLGLDRDGFVWYPRNQIERMLTTGTYKFEAGA